MRNEAIKKQTLRQKRAWRVRKKFEGTAAKPRLCVVKSNSHIQAQLIDDQAGVTLGGQRPTRKSFAIPNLIGETRRLRRNSENALQRLQRKKI